MPFRLSMGQPWEIGRLPSMKPSREKNVPVEVVAAEGMAVAEDMAAEEALVAVVDTEITVATEIDATNRHAIEKDLSMKAPSNYRLKLGGSECPSVSSSQDRALVGFIDVLEGRLTRVDREWVGKNNFTFVNAPLKTTNKRLAISSNQC